MRDHPSYVSTPAWHKRGTTLVPVSSIRCGHGTACDNLLLQWLPLENVSTGMIHVRGLWLHLSKDPDDLAKVSHLQLDLLPLHDFELQAQESHSTYPWEAYLVAFLTIQCICHVTACEPTRQCCRMPCRVTAQWTNKIILEDACVMWQPMN